ncbi:H-2 class I histocompatibility antigen, K-W28 alpha chain-like isoform X2 [Hemicordylus capensis]|uniref:H-2 class I histocompatibility antigen, K-W28 alpha chain-like isoform X2 n=1 Tax=Hemicordylus capensis TaxID=884348 RepID=UPI002304AA9E|nr:H-2 class I histocompatibility antigen, K-W28 alpha chain-like isoform X2 [Hemicordylus capensis]
MWLPFCILLGPGSAIPLPGRSDSSSHTLHHLYLGVSESIQGLPWFTQLGYVDDQLITRYDSNTRKDQPQVPWMEKAEDARFWERETHHARDAEFFFQQALVILQTRYNQSGGLHTWQCRVGCELNKDEKQTGRYMQCGYDGRDFISLDEETFTWIAADDKAQVTKRKWEAEQAIGVKWKGYLEKECIENLQKYLDYAKETLLRTEPPAMKVTRQVGPDGLEILTCHAHGFYPKEIDATWRKNREVWEQETFRGGVTPNSDGTFHTWLNSEIDPKERDLYRCHVEHDGLQKPLDLAWEDPGSVPMGNIMGAVFGAAAAAAGLLVTGIVFYITKSQQDVSRAVQEPAALPRERSPFIPSHVHTDDLPSIYEEPHPSLHRRGFHTLQRISGCELDEHGHRRGFSQHAYDGRELVTWITTDAAAQVSKRNREAEPAVSLYCKRFLEEGCIERLQTFLAFGKETLLRREPPVVKVRHKAGYDVLDTLICRVYGFYPKEIAATWRKDGEVWEQETFRGGVTPNSDGTYHTWLSIEIDPKERSLYQCHMEHDSLLEPLRLTWEDPVSMPNWLIVRAIVVGALLVAILLGAVSIFYIRKQKRDGYKAASSSPGSSSTNNSSSHTLHHLYLGVSESIQGLPWFTQLGYVDDQLITRYDSNPRKDQPQVPWMEKAEDAWFWERETHHARDAEFFFQQALVILQTR